MRILLHRIAVTNPSIDKTTPNLQAGRTLRNEDGRHRASAATPSWRRGIWSKAV